ncbi:hypothetical protein [Hymenobacter glacieicola]|uniref:Uncharacterized protein n=1 Tax=Hymenobacter glacieicola TaxID=1562124 RepID=A0ABQ1WXT0_9BACT|nr:hypothetical protein [Hymenobacter glacieicola]GGG46529.1 hypothetical protein GCM10011378_23400 [Hymenobacter glacieicola]
MKKVSFFALAAIALLFAACNDKKPGAAQSVENVESSGDAQLDAMEEKANAVRDSADARTAALENSTDSVQAE